MCSTSKLYKFPHIKLLCIKASESTIPKNIFIISVVVNRLKEKILDKKQTALLKVVEEKTCECSNNILDTLYMPSLI